VKVGGTAHYGYHANNYHGDDGVLVEMDGLKQMDCIFLGVILSISSTTIILKTLMNWVLSPEICRIVIGSLSYRILLPF
jgi:predicted Kef-type K+ transport protein